jgi:hypothetical protein
VRVAEQVAAARTDEEDVRVVRIRLGETELLEFPGSGLEDEAEPIPAQSRAGELRISGGDVLADGVDHASTISARRETRAEEGAGPHPARMRSTVPGGGPGQNFSDARSTGSRPRLA